MERVFLSRWLFSPRTTFFSQEGVREEKDAKEGRQTVFFTALHPMSDSPEEENNDVTKPTKGTSLQEQLENNPVCDLKKVSG